MKRTAEQIQADKEANRARFTKLKKAFDALTDSQKEQLAGQIVVTCEGHTLSPINTILANFQRPCTIVGGYNQWKKQERHVKKGEKGISIWIPTKPKNEQQTELIKKDENSEENETNFILKAVFDISQTEETIQE